jgi:hypothetical protein
MRAFAFRVWALWGGGEAARSLTSPFSLCRMSSPAPREGADCQACTELAKKTTGQLALEYEHILQRLCALTQAFGSKPYSAAFHKVAREVAGRCKAEDIELALVKESFRRIESLALEAAAADEHARTAPDAQVADTIRICMRLLSGGQHLLAAVTLVEDRACLVAKIASRSVGATAATPTLHEMDLREIVSFMLLVSAARASSQEVRALVVKAQMTVMKDCLLPALVWWIVFLQLAKFPIAGTEESARVREVSDLAVSSADKLSRFVAETDFTPWFPNTPAGVAASYVLSRVIPAILERAIDAECFQGSLSAVTECRSTTSHEIAEGLYATTVEAQYDFAATAEKTGKDFLPSFPERGSPVTVDTAGLLREFVDFHTTPAPPPSPLACASASQSFAASSVACFTSSPHEEPIPMRDTSRATSRWDAVEVITTSGTWGSTSLGAHLPMEVSQDGGSGEALHTGTNLDPTELEADTTVLGSANNCVSDSVLSFYDRAEIPDVLDLSVFSDTGVPPRDTAIVELDGVYARFMADGGDLGALGILEHGPLVDDATREYGALPLDFAGHISAFELSPGQGQGHVVPFHREREIFKVKKLQTTLPIASSGNHVLACMTHPQAQAQIVYGEGWFDVKCDEETRARFRLNFVDAHGNLRIRDGLLNKQSSLSLVKAMGTYNVTLAVHPQGFVVFLYGDGTGNRSVTPGRSTKLKVAIPDGCLAPQLFSGGSMVRAKKSIKKAGNRRATTEASPGEREFVRVENTGKHPSYALNVYALLIEDGSVSRLVLLNVLANKQQESPSVGWLICESTSINLTDIGDLYKADGTDVVKAGQVAKAVKEYISSLHNKLVVVRSGDAAGIPVSFSDYVASGAGRRGSDCAHPPVPRSSSAARAGEEDEDEEAASSEDEDFAVDSSRRGARKTTTAKRRAGKQGSGAQSKKSRTRAGKGPVPRAAYDNFTAFDAPGAQNGATKEDLYLPNMVTFVMSSTVNIAEIFSHAIKEGIFGMELRTHVMSRVAAREDASQCVITAEVTAWLVNGSCLLSRSFSVLYDAQGEDDTSDAVFSELSGPLTPALSVLGGLLEAPMATAPKAFMTATGADLLLDIGFRDPLVAKTVKERKAERQARESLLLPAAFPKISGPSFFPGLFDVDYGSEMTRFVTRNNEVEKIQTDLARVQQDLALSQEKVLELQRQQAMSTDPILRKMFANALDMVEKRKLTAANIEMFREACVTCVSENKTDALDNFRAKAFFGRGLPSML